MGKFKNFFVAILLAALTLSLLISCGTNPADKVTSNNQPVNIKWLMPGVGVQQDSETVWKEFNTMLAQKIPNTSITFEIIPFQDYAEKWQLSAASGAPNDIVWTGYVHDFVEQVNNGCFLPLDDMLSKDAPDLMKELPQWVWQKTRANGKIYAIPNYQMMTSLEAAFMPTELADKYIDTKQLQNVWNSSDFATQAGYSVVEGYLSKLKANGQMQKGINDSLARVRTKGYEDVITDVAYVKRADSSFPPKVYNALDMPELKLFYKTMAGWYQKGYIRKDILSVEDPAADIGKRDGYMIYDDQMVYGTQESVSKSSGYPVTVIPLENQYYLNDQQSMTSTAISRTSSNPERAMEVLNLINTAGGRDMYNLLTFGIEGEHYKKISDNRIETIGYTGSPTETAKYGLSAWVVGDVFNGFETSDKPEGSNMHVLQMNNSATVSSIMGFRLNLAPIKIEKAQIDAVIGEYSNVLRFGAAPDFDKTYNEYIDKLKTAGVDKVVAEVQKQIDTWAAANPKK